MYRGRCVGVPSDIHHPERPGTPVFSQTTCSDSFMSHEVWIWLEIREFENKRLAGLGVTQRFTSDSCFFLLPSNAVCFIIHSSAMLWPASCLQLGKMVLVMLLEDSRNYGELLRSVQSHSLLAINTCRRC